MRTIKPVEARGKYVIFEGKKLLNLCSNDYLGISADDDLRSRFLADFTRSGGAISLPSARLLSGNSPVYDELETLLAQGLGRERALLFNSGYHANVGIYSSLAGSGDAVFCDRLNHASIIDGIKLSGAKLIPFKHLDYTDLRAKLEKYRAQYKKAIISTESLFSMDGDFFDLEALTSLKKEFDCTLIVDEAHSFGIFGNKSWGLVANSPCGSDVDLIMATFGKAIGSYGAFCVSNGETINHLINNARPFIFSTVFPQISAAFAKFVLEEGNLPARAAKLHKTVEKLGEKSHIIPRILGEDAAAVKASEILIQEGFYALPIRYPTVARGASRIRFSLTSLITHQEVEKAFKALTNIETDCSI